MSTQKHAPQSSFKIAALALSFLLLLLLGTLVWVVPPPCPSPAGAGSGRVTRLDSRLAWYVHSGQWRADARTFAALVKYLVAPEATPMTNQPPVPA